MAAAYYKPYMSDDSDSDTDSDASSGYTSEESLVNVPGKKQPVQTGMPASLQSNTTFLSNTAGTKFTSKESVNTTLFMINSRDRDTRVYPQPTLFTIRLPRTYRNIKTVNISQLNLLNSFFNFADTKANTWMYVYEQDRVLQDTVGSTIQNAIKIQIRNGTYTSDDLVTELTNALNSTPLFADITLGKFIDYFQTSGDFTVLFNTPGAVVYNSLTQTYDRNKTISDIVARYFQIVQNVGTVSYSYNECVVAYYYPVLKEMVIDANAPAINYVSSMPAGFASWYDYIVFAFQGLSDPTITAIVLNTDNQALFDAYRLEHTFNKFLVNKYTCTYNSKQGRLVITAPSLNDSIQTDLNSQYNQYLNALVLSNGNFTSVNDFQTRYNTINNSNGALIEFYNFIQSRFSSNFGVDFGRYTAEFYSDSNNEISIYNTLNRYGWNLSLTPQVSAYSVTSNPLPEQTPNFWSNIIIPKTEITSNAYISTIGIPEFTSNVLSFSNAGESQFGYTDVFFPIQPTSYARTTFKTLCRQDISIMTLPRVLDQRDPSTDLVYNLGSTITQTPLLYDIKTIGDTINTIIRTDVTNNPLLNLYTVRQSMFHSADYMRAFDHWLEFVTPQILAGTRIQPDNQNWNQRPPAVDISLTSYRTSIYFQVDADKYLVEPNAHFNITFTAETQEGTNFPVPIKVVWYKDRAGFMADVATDPTGGQENPRHYFKTQTYGTDLSGARMTVDVNNNQQIYFMVQYASLDNIPNSVPLRVFCELTDAYGVYTIKKLTDTYDMPYAGLPLLSDQYTPASDVFKNPTKSIYDSNIFTLGYDISGVSNNILDYIIHAGNNNYYDPNNITDYLNGTSTGLRYQMRLTTGGSGQPAPNISTNWSLYFGPGSSNLIRDTYNTTNNIYRSVNVPQKPLDPRYGNEHMLLNWFQAGNTALRERFLRPSINDSYNTKISTSSVFLPAINPTSLATDSLTSDETYAADISGVSGVGFFLPPNSIVKMDGMLIHFAYTQPSDFGTTQFTRGSSPLGLGGIEHSGASYHNQTTEIATSKGDMTDWDDWFIYNRRNTKLGIFKASDIYQQDINNISLSNAICSLSLEKVTQVCNYQNQLGTLRTREPGWGTYYTYRFNTTPDTIWGINTTVSESNWANTSTLWRSTIRAADNAPTYVAGESSYPDYFLTSEKIYNYSYIPRSYGIATAVGAAYDYPNLVSTATSDIPNSYCAVPFYLDTATNTWKMGSFYGISYTQTPAVPPSDVIGNGAPYYGPPGIFGFTRSSSNTFELHNGQRPSTEYERFYWNTKVRFEMLDLTYNPATDLTKFGGFSGIANEYQDTMLFMYKNQNPDDDYNDVSVTKVDAITLQSTDYWKWGQESNVNYIAYDDQSGYNYLSYVNSVSVRPTIPEYAVHVRAYNPIPQFQTGIRIIGKNYTDFGKPTLWEIANEISSLRSYTPITNTTAQLMLISTNSYYYETMSTNNAYRVGTPGNYFSHEYADALIQFNTMFSTTTTFGKKIGYSGIQYDLYGYQDALIKYIDLFTSIRSLYATYTSILSTATGQLNAYVSDRYATVLPSTIINRNRITDPLPFQFLFQSKLEPPYDAQFDEWGLGWNLGFNKADTVPRTTITSDTFIRITQDYVYLRLNPELNMNTMGVSGKECRGCCQDSAGQDKKYFSKIILNNFGGFCRTAVQLPKEFNPVLGKYETISCQLIDRNGNQIDNTDCEYDFVLELTEITNGPNEGSSLQGTDADLAIYAGEK